MVAQGLIPLLIHATLREGSWKLVGRQIIGRDGMQSGVGWELYDVQRDPAEQRDLAAENPHVVKRLTHDFLQSARRTFILPSPWAGEILLLMFTRDLSRVQHHPSFRSLLFMMRTSPVLAIVLAVFGSAAARAAAPELELSRLRTPYKLNRYVLQKSEDPKAFDSHYATSPFVFRANGRFYMTYVGHDGIGYQTGLACSDDLIHWKKLGRIIGRDPRSSFRRYSIGLTSVLRDHDLFSAGELKKINGRYLGSWLAFPEQGHEAGPAVIGLASSDDLMNWDLTEPILRPEEGAAWECGGLFKSYLLEEKGVYYLFYNAKNKARGLLNEQTGMATSRDLREWTRHPGNPIIPNGPAGSPDEQFASDPVVMKVGTTWAIFYFGLAADRHARELLTLSPDLRRFHKVDEIILDVGVKGAIDDRHAHKPSMISWQGDLYHFYDAVCNAGGPHPTNAVRGISVARSRPW